MDGEYVESDVSVDNDEVEDVCDDVEDVCDEAEDVDEEEVESVSVVSLDDVSSVTAVVTVVVVLGEASWQHSKYAGSHGSPKVNLLKAHPCPIDPAKIPNLQASQQSRW